MLWPYSMSDANDLILQLHNNEWASRVLRRTRAKPLGVVLLVIAYNLLIGVILAASSQIWLPGLARETLLSGLLLQAATLVFQAGMIGGYCWSQSAIQQLFGQIANEGVLASEADLQLSLVTLRNRLYNRWLPPVAIFIGVLSCAIDLVVYVQPITLWRATAQPLAIGMRLPVDFLAFYLLTIALYDLIVVTLAINDLFRNQRIHVQPFHPDKAGGLGAVGRFVANIGYGIGAMGLFLLLVWLQSSLDSTILNNLLMIAMFIVYLLLAPTSFFIPLWSAHMAMLAYRNRLSKAISREFDDVFARLHNPRVEDADQAELLLKRIRQLDEERELLDRFPVWPFNASSVRKFFGLALSPLIPVATSLALDLLSRLL